MNKRGRGLEDENREENDTEEEVEGDINYESEEIEGVNENTIVNIFYLSYIFFHLSISWALFVKLHCASGLECTGPNTLLCKPCGQNWTSGCTGGLPKFCFQCSGYCHMTTITLILLFFLTTSCVELEWRRR